MKKILHLVTGLAWLLMMAGAQAASMTVSPTTVTYTIGSNAFISVNWNITTTGNGGGTATSPNGVYSLDTSVANVGATQIPLTSFATGGASISVPSLTSGTFVVPESFTIPQSVITYAQTNNLSTIYYSRDFAAGAEGYTTPEFVQINLTYPPPVLAVTPGIVTSLTPSVTWSVTTNGSGAGTASSGGGRFSASPVGQTSLGSNTTPLTTSTLPATGTVYTYETIQIPQSVLDNAASAGLKTIYYIRAFSGDPCLPQSSCAYTTNTSSVQINLAQPSPDAVLNISRLALRFSDSTSVKIVQPNTHVMALADISYTGSGLFDAMWEIAEPVSTIGEPVFVPMQPVRQFLVAGGRVYLQSPVLPTSKQGLHILRLTIKQPTLNFAAPVLQYSVNPQGDVSGVMALPPLRINAPIDNALLAKDTRFDWQPVKGAHAYQLELFLPDQAGLKPDDAAIAKRAPASGMMVPAKRNSLTLGELSRSKLRPNTTYYWRIIAIGNKGQILSTSALREIRIP